MTKIFTGMNDIASQVSEFKRVFEHLGYKIYSVVEESNSVIQNKKVDRVIKDPAIYKYIRPYWLQRKIRNNFWNNNNLLDEVIDQYDVFIFMWRSLRPDSLDLKILKEKGKKIVVFFVGSDIRWIDAYEQEMKKYSIPSFYANCPQSERRDEYNALVDKLHYLRHVEKYADLIYNLPNQAQLAMRPYNHFYVPIDLEQIEENNIQRKIPVVAHAPSRRSVKGTDIILRTFDRLKSEGLEFTVNLIENMPYQQALKAYTGSDIMIGELYIPSAGKLDREALAAGCVVLSSIRYDYIDNTPKDCPIIDVNPDTIYQELKNIILDYDRRVLLAKEGRKYVERYHDIKKNCANIIQNLQTNNPIPDYTPSFYRDEFVAKTKKEQEIFNEYTKFVSDCDWYKKGIRQGERNGLVFY